MYDFVHRLRLWARHVVLDEVGLLEAGDGVLLQGRR